MIKIKLSSNNRKTTGTIEVHGDRESITCKIYAILETLTEECPEALYDAIGHHMMDLKEDVE